jgi:3-oxoacyl-[acyl-carrier-protein] synthase-3
VYKWAVRRISQAILELLAGAGVDADDVDWFVPHSANLRIVEALCARTGIARERTLTSIETYGNTSTASIPLALQPAIDDGRVKRGDRILMYGFGGGLVHAGTLLRW